MISGCDKKSCESGIVESSGESLLMREMTRSCGSNDGDGRVDGNTMGSDPMHDMTRL